MVYNDYVENEKSEACEDESLLSVRMTTVFQTYCSALQINFGGKADEASRRRRLGRSIRYALRTRTSPFNGHTIRFYKHPPSA